jgi:hypothetical protein
LAPESQLKENLTYFQRENLFYFRCTVVEIHQYAYCRYIEGNHFRPGTRSKGTHKVLELPDADILV